MSTSPRPRPSALSASSTLRSASRSCDAAADASVTSPSVSVEEHTARQSRVDVNAQAGAGQSRVFCMGSRPVIDTRQSDAGNPLHWRSSSKHSKMITTQANSSPCGKMTESQRSNRKASLPKNMLAVQSKENKRYIHKNQIQRKTKATKEATSQKVANATNSEEKQTRGQRAQRICLNWLSKP
eukprot:4350439-Pleurochrysis_carterae.AAC.1